MYKIIAFGLACIFSFFLFAFMHFMIDGEAKAVVPEPNTVFGVAIDPDDLKPKIRDRRVEKKPEFEEPVKQPAISDKLVKQPRVKPKHIAMAPSLAKEGVPINFGEDVVGLTNGGSLGIINSDGQVSPKVRIEPRYPNDAAIKEIEGYVTLKFDITPDGRTTNIAIVESKPRGVFEKASKRAVRKWKYSPQQEEGKSVAVYNQVVTLNFNLAES